MPVRSSEDIVLVRQAVRQRLTELRFSLVDQTKLVTAASELARNTLDYGGGGTVRLEVLRTGTRPGLRLTFEDKGPGIPVDGLGHGPLAAEAADLAVRAFQKHAPERPRDVLEAMHVALHATRGAAAAVAELDAERQLLTFAGVGNISGAVISTGMRSMVSHNGIVGEVMPRLQEFTYPWPPEALVVLHSNGVTTHWNLDAYPGLARRDPTLIAAILYRDFTRGRDDATVVVVVRGVAR